MELLRLIAVHFGVAAVMGLGFVVAPLAKRLFVAAADLISKQRRRRSEQRLLEVRTLDDILNERHICRAFDRRRQDARPARLR